MLERLLLFPIRLFAVSFMARAFVDMLFLLELPSCVRLFLPLLFFADFAEDDDEEEEEEEEDDEYEL